MHTFEFILIYSFSSLLIPIPERNRTILCHCKKWKNKLGELELIKLIELKRVDIFSRRAGSRHTQPAYLRQLRQRRTSLNNRSI